MSERKRLQRKEKGQLPTKRFRPSTVSRPGKAAMHPPATTSKASTNDRPQVQKETSDSRHPPIENVPVQESTPLPDAGKISGNLVEEKKRLVTPSQLSE